MEKMQEEKKVDYIELFFDLIFVYTFRTVNALVTHGDRFPSLSKMALFYFLLLVALQIWYLTTMYYNRFGRRSFLDYGSLLLNSIWHTSAIAEVKSVMNRQEDLCCVLIFGISFWRRFWSSFPFRFIIILD